MSVWKKIHCKYDDCGNLLGLSDDRRLIVGGLLIEQPKTNILCTKCMKTKTFKVDTSKNFIRYLSESEVFALTGNNLVES